MKQLALIVLLSISALGIAQQSTKNRVITVNGIAEKKANILTYKTDITLTLENNYYGEGPYNTLEDLKLKYFEELTKIGVDTSKLVEDPLAYASLGYRHDGVVLKFETKDKAEIIKLTRIKMAQVLPSYIQVRSEISDKELKNLMEVAMKDARKNANMFAATMGDEINEVMVVASNYDATTYWMSPSSDMDYLRVTVTYSLK